MEKKVDISNIDYWIEDSILYDVKYIVALYLFAVYEGKSILDFISSIDDDFKTIAKKINKYFKTRNDIIKTEDELLNIIHSKEILKKILSI